MSRIQLALNVDNLDEAIVFYSKGGTLNHLGVEVDSSDQVHSEIARLTGEGLFTEKEIGTTCCFALPDKVLVSGPDGERWEVYTKVADSETFFEVAEQGSTGGCCG